MRRDRYRLARIPTILVREEVPVADDRGIDLVGNERAPLAAESLVVRLSGHGEERRGLGRHVEQAVELLDDQVDVAFRRAEAGRKTRAQVVNLVVDETPHTWSTSHSSSRQTRIARPDSSVSRRMPAVSHSREPASEAVSTASS